MPLPPDYEEDPVPVAGLGIRQYEDIEPIAPLNPLRLNPPCKCTLNNSTIAQCHDILTPWQPKTNSTALRLARSHKQSNNFDSPISLIKIIMRVMREDRAAIRLLLARLSIGRW